MQEQDPQLSPPFSRRSIALVLVFFAASGGFLLYRDGGKKQFVDRTPGHKAEAPRVAIADTGANARIWKFYFEDSVLRSGRKAYLGRIADTHTVSGSEFYGLLREAGTITRLPQSDSSLNAGQ